MQYGIYRIMAALNWLIGAFWIVGSIHLYAHKLLLEPNGRSVWQIITNPDGAFNQPKRVKQHFFCRYNIKGRKYLPRLPSKFFVHSCYQSTGTYTHYDTDVNLDGLYSIASYSSTAAELANKTCKVPCAFFSKRVKKSPRNSYCTSLIVLLLCIIKYGSLVNQCTFKIVK